MKSASAARAGIYVLVAAIVLLYVGLTSVAQADGLAASPLIPRLSWAAGAIVAWIAVDGLLVRFWRGGDPMIYYLVRLLLGWGALVSLGAMLSAGHQRLLAAAIVFAVTAAFAGLWLAALSKRGRRSRQKFAADDLG